MVQRVALLTDQDLTATSAGMDGATVAAPGEQASGDMRSPQLVTCQAVPIVTTFVEVVQQRSTTQLGQSRGRRKCGHAYKWIIGQGLG